MLNDHRILSSLLAVAAVASLSACPAQADPKAKPEPEAKAEASAEARPEPKPEPAPAPEPKPAPAPQTTKATPAVYGQPFPAQPTLVNFNAGNGPESVDLSTVIGKKPVVFVYLIAGNKRAEKIAVEVQERVSGLGDGLATYVLVTERPGLQRAQIVERIEAIGLTLPVLNDISFDLGTRLRVKAVPHISMLDADGRLQFTGGGSLNQDLEYGIKLGDVFERGAAGKSIGTYGALPRYYPAVEMVGKRSPDFEAPVLDTGVMRRWTKLLDPNKLNVLAFWSVDCPHCRKSLPKLNEWLGGNAAQINFVGVPSVSNEATKMKTSEFCKFNAFVFPQLVDRDRNIAEMFLVYSTPTFVVVRPDGIIDSVLLSGTEAEIAATLEAKAKALLN